MENRNKRELDLLTGKSLITLEMLVYSGQHFTRLISVIKAKPEISEGLETWKNETAKGTGLDNSLLRLEKLPGRAIKKPGPLLFNIVERINISNGLGFSGQ
jgi:hypothetical protein